MAVIILTTTILLLLFINMKKMELFGKHTTIGVSAKIEPTS